MAPGALSGGTFLVFGGAVADIAFFDFETRSLADLSTVGGYKYARDPSTDILVIAYAFDDGPPRVWSPEWCWPGDDPEQPDELLEHVLKGGLMVAWNCFFDRNIWNHVCRRLYGWPALPIRQTLCAQAQAEANNLPGKLEKAAEALGTSRKLQAGTRLIAQLSHGSRDDWRAEYETPETMGKFRAYAAGDIIAMRDIWQCTRPLTIAEWEEYWASETINERGIAVDVDFARAAERFAMAEELDINAELARVTRDERITVTNHVRKARWLHEQLWPHPELQQIVERAPKDDGKERFSADRQTREFVLEALSDPVHAELFEDDHREKIIDFLELIEAGNSAAVRKFRAISNMEYDGRIHGQYSFNGAGQTGRFSSRGVQIHNLIRDPIEKGNPNRSVDAIEDILMGTINADDLADKYGFPISRLLSRLIRPTFIAADGKQLVWGDWAQIEARVLPWLSMSPGGERVLDFFRSGRDLYKHAAAERWKCRVEDIGDDDPRRQMEKVKALSLQFGGAVGALTAMGRGYGVRLDPREARGEVDQWRAANSWAVNYWHELWEAAISAFRDPGVWYRAGRVKYCFLPQLMRGTLVCQLPCGRWLVYPQFRHERAEWIDKRTGEERQGWRTTFVRSFGSGAGRIDLWYGTLAENITQAAAASKLRATIKRLVDWLVGHTHDEVIAEVEESRVKWMIDTMREAMLASDGWDEGLPLDCEIKWGPFYTK